MREPVYIIGAARTDFARNWKKEGVTLREPAAAVALEAVADAGVDPALVTAGFVGNFAGGLFTRQLHLGALLTDIHPSWLGMPTYHTEAACASGSAAVVAGIDRILAGRADCVIALGIEQQKTMPPRDVGDVMAAAGDFAVERAAYGEFPIPKMFGQIARTYLERTGASAKVLSLVAVKNRENARRNPMAQTRDKALTMEAACSVSEGNPPVADPLKVSDCSQITDGAAAVILASQAFVDRVQPRRRVRIKGVGHATDHLRFDAKDVFDFAVSRKAVAEAYRTAGVGPADIQAAEVHDCFSITEVVACEILGFAEKGQGWKLVESGATRPDGRIPVNVGGGLIGDGHPVGATGVRQLHECYLHLTDRAGDRQVKNARNLITWNMGGSFTTTISFVVGRA